MNDFFCRPYSPQMSFTATGCEVTSSGGSLGGLIASLILVMNDLYQGSSTSGGKRRERWSSGVLYGLLGCDKSAMLFHQPLRGKDRCLHPLDEPGGQGV